ncbi:unnamed protein product [Durusdinium trenchii]|uniref:Inward rectifier potassium channel C-terminal domain-containing protein n=2 Tax=Durusdinium trenchii TaxID=1381693 RepID=A0ABP0QP70_9DINO
MRLIQPDDQTDCYLHLVVPNLIIHEIDHHSPLHPEAKQMLDPGGPSCSEKGRPLTRNSIEEHLDRHNIEIVVLVEGFEPITAACTQGRHSYLHSAEDVVFNCSFAPCVFRTAGKCYWFFCSERRLLADSCFQNVERRLIECTVLSIQAKTMGA